MCKLKNKIKITALLLCFISTSAFSQSKKDIKKLKIKSITETVTVYENEKSISYKLSFVSYTKNAKITEMTDYNRDGSIRRKETATFDEQGNKIEELIYGSLESVVVTNRKTISKYNTDNNKTEDMEYDGKGKFIRSQKFTYDNYNNKKTETVFDAAGKINKKVTYRYDADGLRTERKEYNEKNILVLEKQYSYTFW